MTENRQRLSDKITDEIRNILPSKSCCQKAHICGLIYNCRTCTEGKGYVAFFRREEDANRARDILDSRFSIGEKTVVENSTRGGHRGFSIDIKSKALTGVFLDIDGEKKRDLESAVGFRCAECKKNFIRGVFLSIAVVSEPRNGYRLELPIENEQRCSMLSELLSTVCDAPAKAQRRERSLLYYRSNVKISDLLYAIDALECGFEIANMSIERAIRNNENRATNCVTHNISRSVEATRKQTEAVSFIIEHQKMALLDDELQVTARLRIENDSASLSELAALHNPPITKSGVNGRLRKIIAVAEEVKKEQNK